MCCSACSRMDYMNVSCVRVVVLHAPPIGGTAISTWGLQCLCRPTAGL